MESWFGKKKKQEFLAWASPLIVEHLRLEEALFFSQVCKVIRNSCDVIVWRKVYHKENPSQDQKWLDIKCFGGEWKAVCLNMLKQRSKDDTWKKTLNQMELFRLDKFALAPRNRYYACVRIRNVHNNLVQTEWGKYFLQNRLKIKISDIHWSDVRDIEKRGGLNLLLKSVQLHLQKKTAALSKDTGIKFNWDKNCSASVGDLKCLDEIRGWPKELLKELKDLKYEFTISDKGKLGTFPIFIPTKDSLSYVQHLLKNVEEKCKFVISK